MKLEAVLDMELRMHMLLELSNATRQVYTDPYSPECYCQALTYLSLAGADPGIYLSLARINKHTHNPESKHVCTAQYQFQ